jgi:hypothetical protein
MSEEWSAFGGSDEAGDGFGEFVAGPAKGEDAAHALLREVFGKFDPFGAGKAPRLEAAFPAEWSAPRGVTQPMKVAEQRLMAAVGLHAEQSASDDTASRVLTIVTGMQARRVAWRDEEDLTAGDLCERAGVSVTEVVLVTAADQFVPMSQHASSLPSGAPSLTAEPRLRYLLRRMPQLLENVALAERARERSAQSVLSRAVLEAWRVVLDAGTAPSERRDTSVALVSETTRLDGVRYVPGALLEAGDLRGVAVFRKLVMLGVCKLAMLIQVGSFRLLVFAHRFLQGVVFGKQSAPDANGEAGSGRCGAQRAAAPEARLLPQSARGSGRV